MGFNGVMKQTYTDGSEQHEQNSEVELVVMKQEPILLGDIFDQLDLSKDEKHKLLGKIVKSIREQFEKDILRCIYGGPPEQWSVFYKKKEAYPMGCVNWNTAS
jgi:hypothetical protein